MLQPQNYPRFIGKALLLEPDPFVEMVDDDNPWIEGLFLCACIGVLVAVAQLIGRLLLTASLPSSDALLNTVLQILRQGTASGETLFEIERTLRKRLASTPCLQRLRQRRFPTADPGNDPSRPDRTLAPLWLR